MCQQCVHTHLQMVMMALEKSRKKSICTFWGILLNHLFNKASRSFISLEVSFYLHYGASYGCFLYFKLSEDNKFGYYQMKNIVFYQYINDISTMCMMYMFERYVEWECAFWEFHFKGIYESAALINREQSHRNGRKCISLLGEELREQNVFNNVDTHNIQISAYDGSL